MQQVFINGEPQDNYFDDIERVSIEDIAASSGYELWVVVDCDGDTCDEFDSEDEADEHANHLDTNGDYAPYTVRQLSPMANNAGIHWQRDEVTASVSTDDPRGRQHGITVMERSDGRVRSYSWTNTDSARWEPKDPYNGATRAEVTADSAGVVVRIGGKTIVINNAGEVI